MTRRSKTPLVFLSIDYSSQEEYIYPTAAITAALLPLYMCARIPLLYACGDFAGKTVEILKRASVIRLACTHDPLFWT